MSEPASQAVVIGASAGAVQALLTLLPQLPPGGPPILVVVHLRPDRDNVLPELLAARCARVVKEAEDKEPIRSGVVYLAPADYHLLVEKGGQLALSSDELVNYSRPSIDVLFESAADAWGEGLTGVILTGANHDGARGLRAVGEAGGRMVVQDPADAYASAMPLAALEASPKAEVVPLSGLVATLLHRSAE